MEAENIYKEQKNVVELLVCNKIKTIALITNADPYNMLHYELIYFHMVVKLNLGSEANLLWLIPSVGKIGKLSDCASN